MIPGWPLSVVDIPAEGKILQMKGDGSGTIIVRKHISHGLIGSQASGQVECFPNTELCHLHPTLHVFKVPW